MVPHIHSYYRTAKKIIRHLSNISFLRTCKSLNVIPNGLRAKNKLANTTDCPAAKKLTQQHSRQWLQLAINTQYHRLHKTRKYVFPLIQHEDQEIVRFQNSLNETKQRKLQQLLNRQCYHISSTSTSNKPQGFKNISSQALNDGLKNILEKGPSFVNAEPKHLPRLSLLAKASLQNATDQLKRQNIPDNAINEFKGGMARVIEEGNKHGKKILKNKSLTYDLPPKDIVITPTDKTKRLLALDSTSYYDMLHRSTTETGNYKVLNRLNLPRTEQINFNTRLNKVTNKYRHKNPKLYKDLKATICSEPLPCSAYCLPKDHKEGSELKGRPIHAATDTPATSLSKYLAKSLQELLKHIPAHLKNTDEFINFISNTDSNSVQGFCSLDVCNLYGSIPLTDIDDHTPSIFTVARRFFHQYKADCRLHALSDEDFEELVRLCLTSDRVLIDGKGYKQQSGLAMGNNLAPILATIYMNELDNQILVKSNGLVTLKRFIDDYFAFLLCIDLSGQKLLTLANNLNSAIKFTLELPNNNQLPFLDTLATWNPDTKIFTTTLYIKPIHSRCIIHHGTATGQYPLNES